MSLSRVSLAFGVSLAACADPQYATQRALHDADASLEPELDAAGALIAEAGFDAAVPVTSTVKTEPEKPLDGGSVAPVAAQTDTLPDWALPLLGSYATQSYSFSKDKLGLVSMFEELSLVRITRSGGGAELHSRLCSQVASSSEDELRMLDATGLAEVTRKVTFDDAGHWGTGSTPLGYAYDRAVPAACLGKENQFIPREEHQVWLANGTCRCPSSVDAAPRVDDCRVLDPDHDMKPGLTYTDKGKPGALIGSFIDSTVYAVYVSRNHAVRGRVDAAGSHYADLFVDEVAYQLGCEPDGCPQIGDVGRPCTSDFNSLHFVPLPAESPIGSCAQLLARRAELFPSKAPATPASCSQQVLTDDPARK